MSLWTLSGITQMSQYQKVHLTIFWIFWSKMNITQADVPTIWMEWNIHYVEYHIACLQCFDAVGWVAKRASSL